MKRTLATMLLAMMFSLIGQTAYADAFTITGGRVFYGRLNALEVIFNDPISVTFFAGTDSENWAPPYSLLPREGATVNLSTMEPRVDGFFNVGGTDFTGRGSFSIAAGSVTVPTFDEDVLKTATAPFRFRGVFSGVSETGASKTVSLRGRGTTTAVFGSSTHAGHATWFQSAYIFDNVSPTPEPSTFLLMGTAVAFVARRLRRSRTKARD